MHYDSFEFCPLHAKGTIDAVCKNTSDAVFPSLNNLAKNPKTNNGKSADPKTKNGKSASKTINDDLKQMEEFWKQDRSIDRPLFYTPNLTSHSTRSLGIEVLSNVHNMNPSWIDNRAGLIASTKLNVKNRTSLLSGKVWNNLKRF